MNPVRILCILLLLVSLRLAAQTDGVFRTERLGTKDGLSHRWTMCALQDAKGYLWVGTYDGLNRYDGHDFRTYRPSDNGKFPVSADLIYQLAETSDGKFYLTSSYGILRFDPETADFDLVIEKDFLHTAILLNPGRGVPFLEAGIERWGDVDVTLTIYEPLPSGKLSALATLSPRSAIEWVPVQCDKDAIWFWDFKGTYQRFGYKEQTWSRHPVSGTTDVPVDAAGNLWLPDGPALRSFALPANKPNLPWSTFNIEPGRGVWLVAPGEGDNFTLVRYDLKDGSLESVLLTLTDEHFGDQQKSQPYRPRHWMDEENTIWCTGFLGLYKVRRTDNLFQHYLSKQAGASRALSSGISVREMAEDGAGNIYLRSADQHVYKINPTSGAAQKINLPPVAARTDELYRELQRGIAATKNSAMITSVHSILGNRDGTIWLSSHFGLFQYHPETGKFHLFYAPTPLQSCLFTDENDRIWRITGRETLLLNKGAAAFERRAPEWNAGDLFYGIMLPKEHTLWGFTDTGLVKINTLNFETRYIRLYDRSREQRCLVSHRGWLWVGTSRGLEKVNPETFAHTNYDRSKGLPGNFVYSMIADGDYLWLGTSDGLCRFNIETGAVKNYYVEDGLSNNEFNTLSAFKARNGKIYMGGLNGVNAFFPADLEGKKAVRSRILLSRFSLFDAEKDSLVFLPPSRLTGQMELSPSVTSFNLNLALTSYLDPAKNQYAWRMDGLDGDWYYAGNQHVAAYRYIPPGSYTFRAKAADSFGNWSENELTLNILVLRPWYSRWWAWGIYLLAVSTAAYLLYRFQLSKKIEHVENRRLRELDEFRSRFFTNITHEFRTPLTVILGVSEQVKPDVNEAIKGKIGLIHRNGQNLLRLINQILDLAKLESNTLKIDYVQGDVLPYLRYITESLQSLANAQNVLLRVDSSEGELLMDYDPERLLQIVHNLLSNAIKFTPSGGRVTLRADLTTFQKLSNLVITVADTGTGISPEDLPNVFDRFYQANNLEKAKAGGTGIGLSLTMELVKVMGGDITVESEVGKGATFQVRLPITCKAEHSRIRGLEDLNPAMLQPSNLPPSESSPNQILNSSNPHLLIIEDNPDVVEYLIACLGEKYRLDYAYNGRSGIEKAIETVPDLIVSDVMMPEKDGFEVCETLKNDERTSHIPIILLTARADAASRIAGLRRGADAYLSKPFNKEELLAQLQVLAEKQRRMATWLSKKAQNEHPLPLPEADILVEDAFVQKVRNIVAKNYPDENFGLPQLCREIGMSRSQLFRKMSALIAISPSDFIRSHRLNAAKNLLETTDLNVSEVAWQCGFVNLAHFSKIFQEEFGVQPSATGKQLIFSKLCFISSFVAQPKA